MKTINWRHTDWFARRFVLTMGAEIIGRLTFYSAWHFNALYTEEETELKFAQKSFWDRDIAITKDGKTVAEIRSSFFGEHTLKLNTGEKYILSTSFWEQEVYWKTERGETVVKYQQATMSSTGKGLISLSDSLPVETTKLLVSSGLFARQVAHKRRAVTIAILVPILAAAST